MQSKKINRQVDVLILYEHVARELETALILKILIEDKGYKALVRKIHWNEGISNYFIKPKIIVTPWCYDNEEYDYFYSNWVGGYPGNKLKVFNLHCEQLAGISGTNFLLPQNSAKNVYHFAWGEYFKQQLIKSGVDPSYIYVTGSPRLDYFKEHFRIINYSKSELANKYGLDNKREWVLLIGNFSAMNSSTEAQKRIAEKGFSEINRMSELSRKSYEIIIDWYDQCISEFKEYEFIYRPHPSENITDAIRAIEERHSNFHVIKDLAISDWIINSSLAYAWCSTSAFEVVSANVPIFNLRPIEMPEDLKFPMLESIKQIPDITSFKQSLLDFQSNSFGDVNSEFRNEMAYYFMPQKTYSTSMMNDIIVESLRDENNSRQTHYSIAKGIIGSIRFVFKNVGLKFGLKTARMDETLLHDLISRKEMQTYVDRAQRIIQEIRDK